MATLQKIRNKAGLLAVIIGLALFAFIIGDALNSGSSLFRQSQQKISVIGDFDLDIKDYEARILEMEEVYKIQSGQTSLDEAVSGQIRESVYENIVRETILDQQAAALGVSVTGKEVFSMISGANVHPMIQQLPIFRNPQTGQFDQTIMINVLQTIQNDDLSAYGPEDQEQIKQIKTYWLFWENSLKYNRLEEKINMILSKAVQANSLDAKTSFDERSNNVDFTYVFQPYSALSDSLFKVSPGSIKKRYNKEIERFAQKPNRAAKYIVVDIKPSTDDYQKVEKSIKGIEAEFAASTDFAGFVNEYSDNQFLDCYVANRLYEGAVKDFINSGSSYLAPTYADGSFNMARVLGTITAPDSVKARQIVLSPDEETRADSLLAVLKAGGNFDELARKFSRNPNGSDMGWFREIDALAMGTEFVRSCFNASLNTYFSVKSKRSINIVQVTDRTAPVAKTKLALVTMKVSPSDKTYSESYNKLNLLVAKYQDAETFFTEAAKAGYEVQENPMMYSTDFTLGQIPQMRQAVKFVFNNDPGKLSTILENQHNQFVVIGVTEANDDDYQAVNKVENILKRELVNEKKAEKMIADIKALNATSLQALAQSLSGRVDSARFVTFASRGIVGIGEEPALLAAVTKAPANQLSAPIKGKNGVYVFQVNATTKSQEPFNIQQEMAAINGQNMYRIMYLSFEAARKATKIKDTRIRFY